MMSAARLNNPINVVTKTCDIPADSQFHAYYASRIEIARKIIYAYTCNLNLLVLICFGLIDEIHMRESCVCTGTTAETYDYVILTIITDIRYRTIFTFITRCMAYQ